MHVTPVFAIIVEVFNITDVQRSTACFIRQREVIRILILSLLLLLHFLAADFNVLILIDT